MLPILSEPHFSVIYSGCRMQKAFLARSTDSVTSLFLAQPLADSEVIRCSGGKKTSLGTEAKYESNFSYI